MVAQIKEWFAAPVFPDDAHKTRRAELLNAGLIAAIALTLIISAGNILGGIVPPIVTGLNLALAILCFFLRHSMRRGQIEAASVGLIVLGFGIVTANVANLGTIRTPTTTVYLLLVILGGLLFDRPGVVVTTVFSSLIVLGMIFAENAGFLPRPNLSVTMTQWITYTTLFGFGGGLTLFGLEATRHVLARVDHELAERQRAEKTIRYQADLINQVSGAIISTNPQYRIVSWNRGAEEMFGWRADEVIGKSIAEVVKTDYRTISREQMIHDLLERDVWQGEVIQYHKNGTPNHILITISTMKDDTGKLIGIVSVNRDVTERKKWEEAIRNLARFPSENPN
ncbi:partial Blue-light-activated protein, partial [Anaerolineae bacterium]